MISPAALDILMHRAWPALHTVECDGWIVRTSDGITQRANSVLPVRAPHDLRGTLEAVEELYRGHGLQPIFQISPAAQPAGLDAMLAERGYEYRAPTLVQSAAVGPLLDALPPAPGHIAVERKPSEEWMDLWWSVDGRGDSAAMETARGILLGCPALYARGYDGAGIVAAGRLALVDSWGGIYCMAVRRDARRRGHGRALLWALVGEAARLHIDRVWLQVVEGNAGARALYEAAGFMTVSRYHYRVHPTVPHQS